MKIKWLLDLLFPRMLDRRAIRETVLDELATGSKEGRALRARLIGKGHNLGAVEFYAIMADIVDEGLVSLTHKTVRVPGGTIRKNIYTRV